MYPDYVVTLNIPGVDTLSITIDSKTCGRFCGGVAPSVIQDLGSRTNHKRLERHLVHTWVKSCVCWVHEASSPEEVAWRVADHPQRPRGYGEGRPSKAWHVRPAGRGGVLSVRSSKRWGKVSSVLGYGGGPSTDCA